MLWQFHDDGDEDNDDDNNKDCKDNWQVLSASHVPVTVPSVLGGLLWFNLPVILHYEQKQVE